MQLSDLTDSYLSGRVVVMLRTVAVQLCERFGLLFLLQWTTFLGDCCFGSTLLMISRRTDRGSSLQEQEGGYWLGVGGR